MCHAYHTSQQHNIIPSLVSVNSAGLQSYLTSKSTAELYKVP